MTAKQHTYTRWVYTCSITFLVLALSSLSSSHALPRGLPQRIRDIQEQARDTQLRHSIEGSRSSKNSIKEEARVDMAKLGLASNATSYAGYINVDRACSSNLFYWFFPAQNGNPKAPVVMWLQGGYGSSSLFGLFIENGPIQLTQNLTVEPRMETWNTEYSMLYVDQPVGTGFSYTLNNTGVDNCYLTNQTAIADAVYTMLQEFFSIYPEYSQNDFIVSGESMAGKYVPSISYRIHQGNSAINKAGYTGDAISIPLKGFTIGNGLVDPITQHTTYAELAQGTGIASSKQTAHIQSLIEECTANIQSGNFAVASNVLNGIPDYICTIAGTSDSYDIRRSTMPPYPNFGKYVNSSQVRATLNVGNRYYQGESSQVVWNYLAADFARSVRPAVVALLDAGYRGMFYNGQFDIMVGPAATEAMLNNLTEYTGYDAYINSERVIWKVQCTDSEVAGWVRSSQQLTQVSVRNAGHMAPADQPRAIKDLFTRWMQGGTFGGCQGVQSKQGKRQRIRM